MLRTTSPECRKCGLCKNQPPLVQDQHDVHHGEAVFIAHPDHEFAALQVVKVSDLKGQALISLPSHDQLETALRRALADKNVVPSRVIETIYSSTICSFVARGLGVGVINSYMASVFKGQLLIRKFSPKIPVTTYVRFARFTPASEPAQRFLEELRRLPAHEWS